MDVRVRTTLPSTVSTPATARALARDAVERGRATVRLDDVALVVSELVTNAVVHGTGEITLDLTVAADAVRVEVADEAPADLPGALPLTPDSESGRGLFLVSKIARDWGVRAAGGGKVVWADLAG